MTVVLATESAIAGLNNAFSRHRAVPSGILGSVPSGARNQPVAEFAMPDPSGAQLTMRGVAAHGGLGMVLVASVISCSGERAAGLPWASGCIVRAGFVPFPAPTFGFDGGHRCTVPSSTVNGTVPATASAQVEFVQEALSLSVTQVAEIIGVQRATVHNWLRSEQVMARDPQAGERLRQLCRVASRWQALSPADPRDLMQVPLGDGTQSLLSLLRSPDWDEAAISRALDAVADLASRRSSDRRKLRSRGTLQPSIVRADAHVETEDLESERHEVRLSISRARRHLG